jgi:hypothetical protein
MFHLISFEFQIAPDDIENDIAHSVTDMADIVGGNAADIHPDLIAQRHKLLFLP